MIQVIWSESRCTDGWVIRTAIGWSLLLIYFGRWYGNDLHNPTQASLHKTILILFGEKYVKHHYTPNRDTDCVVIPLFVYHEDNINTKTYLVCLPWIHLHKSRRTDKRAALDYNVFGWVVHWKAAISSAAFCVHGESSFPPNSLARNSIQLFLGAEIILFIIVLLISNNTGIQSSWLPSFHCTFNQSLQHGQQLKPQDKHDKYSTTPKHSLFLTLYPCLFTPSHLLLETENLLIAIFAYSFAEIVSCLSHYM